MDILRVVRRGHLIDAGAKTVVGVSGGADSLCLLHVLHQLQSEFDWSLHVAHLNHCLRGPNADEDMAFVARIAREWGMTCSIETVDVPAIAAKRRLSIEETARQVRYGFLAKVAHGVGATFVAVGHHADDQSETVLMHFLRGTGLAGLRGMLPTTDLDGVQVIRDHTSPVSATHPVRLVRPLLSVPRTVIEAYCQSNCLEPRIDLSNLDVTYYRNRLRHELLPLLETYNPNIRAGLRRTAHVVQADYDLLASCRDAAWAQMVREDTTCAVSFELIGWRGLPLALQRSTLRLAAQRLRPLLRDIDYVHIHQAVKVANHSPVNSRVTLPQGLHLTIGYDTLRLSSADQEPTPPDWPLVWHDESTPVAVPGETTLQARPTGASKCEALRGGDRGSQWRLETLEWNVGKDAVLCNPDRWTAYVDADVLGTRLSLRRRRPGDLFQPLGMYRRTVKVADFMINVKIPRQWREHIPLLVFEPADRGADEIAWIVGWRIDERVKVTETTRRIVRLRWLGSERQPTPPSNEEESKRGTTR